MLRMPRTARVKSGLEFGWEKLNWKDPGDPFAYRRYYEKIDEWVGSMSGDKMLSVVRDLCKYDTFYLGTRVLGHRFMDIPHAWKLCAEVDNVDFGSAEGLNDTLWLLFREGFKSTILTGVKSIQQMCEDRNMSKLLLSNTNTEAKYFMKEIMETLEKNKRLPVYFEEVFFRDPKKQSPQWSLDRGIVINRDGGREPTMFASGLVDGSLSKRHVDIIEYDDAVTEESVTTEEQIRKTDEAIELSIALGSNIATPGSDEAKFYFVGTRYDDADSYGKLIESGEYRTFIKTCYVDDDLEAKIPRAHSMARLDKIRRKMSPYIFSCQYLMDPVPKEERKFKKGLTFYDQLPERLDRVLLWDPAGGMKKDRDHDIDNTAGAVIGRDIYSNEYFIDGVYDHLEPRDRVRKALDLAVKHHCRAIYYEKVGMQGDYQELMRWKGILGIEGIEIIPFNPREYGKKEDRIERALMHRIAFSVLKFPQWAPYFTSEGKEIDLVTVVQDELKRFPRGRHDDMIDCLSQLLAVPIYGNDAEGDNVEGSVFVSQRSPRNPKKVEKQSISKKWA
jgi:phage terminase large subunit-like protein